MVLGWVVLGALQVPRCWSWRWPEVLLRRWGSSPFPCLLCFFNATPFFLLLLLYCSFLSFASFFHFFHSNEPPELFLAFCGGGSNEDWLGFLVMEKFVDACLRRVGGVGFFFRSSTLLACSALSFLLFNATPSLLPDFTGQQQRGCGLWTSLLGKTQHWRGSNVGRVQQISKAAAVMINKASNEQGNGSWLSSKGATSPRWGTSIGCWRGSPE